MMRFISTLCLLVGASVASYAGVITSTAGLVGGSSNLLSFNDSGTFDPAVLGNFGTTLPLTAYFPNGIAVGGSGVNVTITSSGPVASGGTRNTGDTGTLGRGASGTTGYYISTQNFDDASLSTSFARFITLTFDAPIGEFLIDYLGSNNPSSNYFFLNGLSGTTYALTGTNGQIGFTGGASINSITFSITGNDSIGTFGGDAVIFDNLIVNTVGSGSSGSSGSTGGGEVPEPSTYALIGAGLLSAAFARRKK